MINIYFASKIKHARYLRTIRKAWEDLFNINSRWLDQCKFEVTNTENDFKIAWLIDEEDVANADAIVIYAEEEDELKGALVEAGIAIALGKLVIAVGEECESFGTWTNHPLVIRVNDLKDAKKLLVRRFIRK